MNFSTNNFLFPVLSIVAVIIGLIAAYYQFTTQSKYVSVNLRFGFVLFIITTIFVILGSVFIFFPGTLQPWTSTLVPSRVLIVSPADGSKVFSRTIVQGTASNIPKGEELWLLVMVDGVQGFFPVGGPIEVKTNGEWSLGVTIGIDKDSGKKFELYAVLANQSGRDAIGKYFKQIPNPNYVGINPLPQGIRVMNNITVIRS